MADIGRVIQSNVAPASTGIRPDRTTPLESGGASFRSTLNQVSQSGLTQTSAGIFAPLKFSTHAIERMRLRGIKYTPEQMRSIEAAVSKAQQKGARSTLLLAGDTAMIVSPENRTVVTVMDKNALKENVFTNIDSTVVI